MDMRKRLIAGIIIGLSASSIGVASISASAATTTGATANSIHAVAPDFYCGDMCLSPTPPGGHGSGTGGGTGGGGGNGTGGGTGGHKRA
jgi:hypothetical protein